MNPVQKENMSSNLLQCERLNPSPAWHIPLQRDGTSDIPSSLKLSDSGHTPKQQESKT